MSKRHRLDIGDDHKRRRERDDDRHSSSRSSSKSNDGGLPKLVAPMSVPTNPLTGLPYTQVRNK